MGARTATALLLLVAQASGFAPAANTVNGLHSRCSERSMPATMKVFAWKARGEAPPELSELSLSNLKASPGSNKPLTRKGRGVSAGQGVTCGFGNRGQKSRSGKPTRPGFEGGQIPLNRRLPKFVGRPMGMSHTKTEYSIIKLSALNVMPAGSVVDYPALQAAKAVSKSKFKVHKVVGSPEGLTAKDLTVRAHAFTATAREAIEANGGKCVEISPTTGLAEGESAPAA